MITETEVVALQIEDLNGNAHYSYDRCLKTAVKDDAVFLVDQYVPITWASPTKAIAKLDRITLLKFLLREERRLKHNCDYAIVHKYDQTRITTAEVYKETIQEYADKLGLEIKEWFLFK